MYFKLLHIVVCSFFIGAHANNKHYIDSPKVTGWGTWGNLDRCPDGQYAIGMQLKVERSDGWKDDTGLNGIRFFCSKLGEGISGEVNVDTPSITSSVGPFGDWKSVYLCGDSHYHPGTTGVIGFQLKSEKDRGRLDDTAANNLRMICSDFGASHVSTKVVEGDGTQWGDWTSARQCNPGYAICGLKTQVEKHAGSEDDTALNNLKAECCEVKLEKEKKSSEEVVIEDRPSRKASPTDFAQSYKEDIEKSKAQESYQPPVTDPPTTTTTTTPATTTTTVTPTTTEDLPPTTDFYILSTEDPSTSSSELNSAEQDEKARYTQKVLATELSQLAELDFGTSKSNYTINIPSNESVSVADIQEANPMVPPEVIYIAANAAADGDLNGDINKDNDPDPSQVQYISGSVKKISQTSTAPTPTTTNDLSVELNEISYNSAQCLLLPSSLFKLETLSLIAMYCIMRILV